MLKNINITIKLFGLGLSSKRNQSLCQKWLTDIRGKCVIGSLTTEGGGGGELFLLYISYRITTSQDSPFQCRTGGPSLAHERKMGINKALLSGDKFQSDNIRRSLFQKCVLVQLAILQPYSFKLWQTNSVMPC